MNESEQAQAIQCDEHWTLEQINADGKEDDEFWESPEFDLFAVDSVRFYTQKRALIKYVDSQAQKIAGHEKTINEQADALADFEDLYKVLTKYYEDRICYSSLRDAINHFKAMRG